MNKKDLETFNSIFTTLLQDEINNPVSKILDPTTLNKSNELDLSLGDDPMDDDAFNTNLKNLVLSSPKTASSRFFNQLFGGRTSKAVLGELLAVVLNNGMHTYKIGGPQVCIEREIIKQVCNKIGYGENSGGTFPTGGSMSNFMALLMARDYFDKDIKVNGVQKQLIAYTSTASHYSIAKNASFSGIGRDNVRYIEVDSDGRMKVDALEKQIEKDLKKGLCPFFVNATAGSTVLATYDPIKAISILCKKYKLWLHIDGALGGAVMFSDKFKYLLSGMYQADSLAFNAHKSFGVPLSCSMILVRHKKHLYDTFSNDADYLYQTNDDELNLGKISLQCGRRNDALKFWTLWKSVGSKGLETIINHQFALAKKAHKYVNDHPDYTVYNTFPSISICFNYKNLDPQKLCSALNENQQAMIGYGTKGDDTFIRLVVVNANNDIDEILEFFSVLENFVENNNELIIGSS